ncbi:2045_t:CDS:1, partial [Funneliformis geosporum]
ENESVSDDLLISETFEDYSSPKYKLYQDEEESLTIDNQFTWILLWIMNF